MKVAPTEGHTPLRPRPRRSGDALAALVVVVSLFLPSFGVSVGPIGVTVSGLKDHDYLWVVFALGVGELLLLGASERWPGVDTRLPARREALVAELHLLALATVVVAFLAKSHGAGWRSGAVLALAAAAVGALGTLPAVPAGRGR